MLDLWIDPIPDRFSGPLPEPEPEFRTLPRSWQIAGYTVALLAGGLILLVLCGVL